MKTKYLIMQSMEKLLSEYSYNQITVVMITSGVPIARQGFYKLYKDKEDLSRQMFLYFMDRAASMDQKYSLREFISHDLTEINKHIIFFNKLAVQSYNSDLFQILHGNIYNIYMKMLRYRIGEVSKDMAFMLDGYCVGGLYKLIRILQEYSSLDVNHLTDIFADMMPDPIKQVLDNGKYPPEILAEK